MADATQRTVEIKIAADVQDLQRSVKTASDGMVAFSKTLQEVNDKLAKQEEQAHKHKGVWEEFKEGLSKVTEVAFGFNEVTEALTGGLNKLIEPFKQAGEIAKFAAELDNLRMHVPTGALEGMQRATEGTVRQTDLLKIGMKALNGEIHVNAMGLELVMKTAQRLHDEGFGPTTEIAEKLFDALRKGSSRSLKEFGISLTDTKDKAHNAAEMIKEFQHVAEHEIPVNEGLKRIEEVEAAWGDLVDSIKHGLGEIVMAIGEGIARLLGLLKKSKYEVAAEAGDKAKNAALYNGMENFEEGGEFSTAYLEGIAPGASPAERALAITQAELAKQTAIAESLIESKRKEDEEKEGEKLRDAAMTFILGGPAVIGKYAEPTTHAPHGISPRMKKWLKAMLGDPQKLFDAAELSEEGQGLFSGFGAGANRSIYDLLDQDQFAAEFGSYNGKASKNVARMDMFNSDANIDFIAKQRQLVEFNKSLMDTNTMAGAAFQTLSQGLAAGVEAAITGSDSIGKAALKAGAKVLQSIAVQAVGKAAMEVADAIAQPWDAARHLAAAAKYGAAALIAGAGSAALNSAAGGSGGGGGSNSPSGSSGYPAGTGLSGAANTQPQSQTINVYVSGAITAGDHAKLGEVITKAVDQAKQAGRARSDSTVTVRYE